MAAATYAELKKALPKAKAEIIVRCLDKGLDLDAARAEFDEDMSKTLAEVTEELVKARAELDELKTAEAKAKAEEAMKTEEETKEAAAKAKAEEEEKQAAAAKARGVKPAKTVAKAKSGQSATARWNDAVAEKIRAGLPRAKAVRAVAIDDPDLQAEFIAEANAA